MKAKENAGKDEKKAENERGKKRETPKKVRRGKV